VPLDLSVIAELFVTQMYLIFNLVTFVILAHFQSIYYAHIC